MSTSLYSDFSEGWKKSIDMKILFPKRSFSNPIGVGVILYLNHLNGCFNKSI